MLVTGYANFPLRIDFDLRSVLREEALIQVQTSTTFVIDTTLVPYIMYGGPDQAIGLFTFTGENFQYNTDGEPIAGTITGLQFTAHDGSIPFKVSGLNLSATVFRDALYAYGTHPFNTLFAGNDEFRGTNQDDLFIGLDGHDLLSGREGSDTINGGKGNDHIFGQSSLGGPDSGDTLAGDDGSDYIQGNAGDDDIDGGRGSDRINGGQGRDYIFGNDGNDTINGNRDNDSINGHAGDDLLRGGQGNDILTGSDGDDILMGDKGADQLDGGSGKDIFVFGPGTSEIGSDAENIDRLKHFLFNQDRFSLGFKPEELLLAQHVINNVPTTIEAARIIAQSLFDQHAGNHEVGFVRYGELQSTLMFWASDGGATIDSVLRIGNVGNFSDAPRTGDMFQLIDFI